MARIRNAFDIMSIFAVAATAGIALPSPMQPDAAETLGASNSTSESGIFWLPLPVEEIETPERLDVRADAAIGFSVRASARDGVAAIRQIAVAREGGSVRAECSLVGESAFPRAGTVAVRTRDGNLGLVAGRVGMNAAGALFSEAIGFSKRAGRVPVARANLPALEAPAAASSPAIEGIGLRRAHSFGSAQPGIWLAAGRRVEDFAPLGALGISVAFKRGSCAAALGSLGGLPVLGFAGAVEENAASFACELVVARESVAALVAAESAPGPLRLRGRWRYRSLDARPVACELSAEGGTRAARARVRMGGGASGAFGVTGRVEIEGRLSRGSAGALTFRLGRSDATGFSSAAGFTARRERYEVLEATLPRVGNRTLSLLATRRTREIDGRARAGSSLGGRLGIMWCRRGRLEIVVEAARTDAGGGAAWGSGLYTGGSTALRTRSQSGLAASARGLVRLGPWGIGGLIEGREDTSGRRATVATIWIQRG